MKKRIGIQGFLIFLAIALSILLYKFLFPQGRGKALDEFLDAIGIIIILVGFLFRVVARGYKSENSNNGENLITDGPYALMRNPMYFGTLVIGMGVILVLFEWWVFFVFLFIFLMIYIPQMKREEIQLSARFGKEYETYSKKTPKYFPKLKKDTGNYLLFNQAWVKRELPSLIGVTGVVIAAETWADTKLFGTTQWPKELVELSLIPIAIIFAFFIFLKKKDRRS